MTTLRENRIKIGAKVMRLAKYVTFQLAEVAVMRELLAAIFDADRSVEPASPGGSHAIAALLPRDATRGRWVQGTAAQPITTDSEGLRGGALPLLGRSGKNFYKKPAKR